ncbi:MAG: hypothetical protein AVDCRST_MAG68-304 [uncultured Gemmatimonadetes bacterium]|uniref:Uncharacterized protein n=1 Tax=uncultured Gemmatimonadota bacterium TaxID=203437 RepID=A0A6J4KA16_9BACT|nr:MAG: hypothetical protein AVDCRST_MAG68-304 [uncultured Gemmatimonadota bacterium]
MLRHRLLRSRRPRHPLARHPHRRRRRRGGPRRIRLPLPPRRTAGRVRRHHQRPPGGPPPLRVPRLILPPRLRRPPQLGRLGPRRLTDDRGGPPVVLPLCLCASV